MTKNVVLPQTLDLLPSTKESRWRSPWGDWYEACRGASKINTQNMWASHELRHL